MKNNGNSIENSTKNSLKNKSAILSIQDLHVSVSGKPILKGIDLDVYPGEVHAIMGPNGSGKSTLAQFLAGREGYQHTTGNVLYHGQNLLEMPPEKRACEGVFLGFQYPVEIAGVGNTYFLKGALNAIRKYRGEMELDAVEFLELARQKMKILELDPNFLERSLNHGFSGGEKKRNEIFQMAILEPTLSLLDETDSGLDIDALKIVADAVDKLRSPDRAIVLITHYQRLLSYIVPDRVHVLSQGKIVRSGGPELALELEERGYGWLTDMTGTLVTARAVADPVRSVLS